MTIRTIDGHTEVFISPEKMEELTGELYRARHLHKYTSDGKVVNPRMPFLTLRDGDAVIRFRIEEELVGIDPDPAVYYKGMPKGDGCQ